MLLNCGFYMECILCATLLDCLLEMFYGPVLMKCIAELCLWKYNMN